MDLTERRDLRGGRPLWTIGEQALPPSDPLPVEPVDIAIIGAGVMGAMLADRLTRDGKRVALIDRRPPAHGSTAASTALVMWAADVPLTHLAGSIGMDAAARRWRRVHDAIQGLRARIDAEGIDCDLLDRPDLYLAGNLLDDEALRHEGDARSAARLPSLYLEAEDVGERFGITPCAALLSRDCFLVDPVKLSLAMLDRARGNGATISYPADALAIEAQDGGIRVTIEGGGELVARNLILATGYERARWFLPEAFSILSSYAIATPPGTAHHAHEGTMIWQAADPYLYARAGADGRIIAGGEDEPFADAQQRDARIEAKSGVLAAKLAAMLGRESVTVDCAWAASFGASPDGLPAIGRAANHDHVWLASGFGGNGISFAALAAELIGAAMAGEPDADAECFDPYRFG